MGGSYNKVAETEIQRQQKLGKGKVDFKPVVYGEEERCPTCWTIFAEKENSDGTVSKYCFNCYFSHT